MRNRIRDSIWPVATTLQAGAALLLMFGTIQRLEKFPYDSDHLSLVEILDELLEGQGLVGWHQPPAPQLFPDIPLLLPGRLLFADLALVYATYAILFYSFIILALAWLGHELGLTLRAAWSAGCLGVALVLAVNLAPPYLFYHAFLIGPDTHLGLMPIGLLILAFVLRSLRRGYAVGPATILAVAGGLTVASDRLLVIQFLAPIGGALILLRVRGGTSTRRLLASLLLLTAMVALSFLFLALLIRSGQRFLVLQEMFSWPGRADLVHHAGFIWDRLKNQHALCAILALSFVVAAVVLGANGRRLQQGGPEATRWLFALILLFAWLSGFVPPLVMAKQPAHALMRYQFALTILPSLLLATLCTVAPWDRFPTARLLLPGALAAFIGWLLIANYWHHGFPTFRQPYPELAQALDALARERGCRFGLANYWQARRLHYLTQEHVRVLPTAPDGSPFLHDHNPDDWLAVDRRDRCLPAYQFVIFGPKSGGPSPVPIRWEFGEPIERRVVGEHEIWVYERLESSRFRGYLNSLLARRYESRGGWVAPTSPGRLGKPKDGFQKRRPSDSVLTLGRGKAAELHFAGLTRGCLLDFSGECDSAFQVTFLRGTDAVGSVEVPTVGWYGTAGAYGPPGLRSRLIPLPAEVRNQGWDRVAVCNQGPRESAAVGHFLVFADSHEPDAPPAPPCRRVRFEAEDMFTACGETVADAAASGGLARFAAATAKGPVVYGPYIHLPPGRYRMDFVLKADACEGDQDVVTIDVTSQAAAHVLAKQLLRGSDFPRPNHYTVFSLDVETANTLDLVEFRALSHGQSVVWVDHVELIPLK